MSDLKIGKYYQTNIENKMKHFDDFFGAIKRQLEYGATKYASEGEDREATDMLVEAYGQEWVLGTMNKYLYRFKNLGREKDLLKIATYCYLVWLQNGFHLLDNHEEDVFNEQTNN